MPSEIRHNYAPRELFLPFHERTQRWAIEVVHRRGGKTVAAVNDAIARVLAFSTPQNMVGEGRFAYIAPFYNQAKQVAWDYVKSYTRGMTSKVSEAELSVTFKHNGAKMILYGADNPDSMRGLYFDGVVLDEYGDMRPSLWSQVVLPTLIDRNGWAVFIGTPNGPNHFRDLYYNALADPARWFVERHPVSETKLIPEEELQEMKRLMLPEEYAQEMECSFEASTRGAFYVAEMMETEEAGRIRELAANEDMPLHFAFDLGYSDDTAMVAYQDALDGYPILHAESDHYRPVAYYVARMESICKEYGVERGHVWLPHDAWAKSMQTQRSIQEQFMAAGIKPKKIPNLSIVDGIAAARLMFDRVYFNATSTKELILALKTYRREYDEDKKAFRNKPLHDWSSHFADAFRYFALVAGRHMQEPDEKPKQNSIATGANYAFSLNDIWDTQETFH